ncbi:DUF1566 domain-containing protein, partial [Chromatium okenii]|uniref:Lcl domain-containing protein n=1 Tax=Chromatium okenii TaxID=61644 RepID=UPI0026F2C0B9
MLDCMRPFHSLARWAGLITLLALIIPAHAAGLNDTGITTCSNATQNGLPCPVAGFPGQDAEFGTNGFDFTKLDAAGNDLPATATNHVCVRDNVTGLIWEVKTDDGGLRDQNHTYTWYDSNSTDSNKGTVSGGTCYKTGRCDTDKFVQDVNSAGLCGFNNWRMPKIKELYGIMRWDDIVDDNYIDANYFPNINNYPFWSGSPNANDSDSAWVAGFYDNGFLIDLPRNDGNRVRLVRVGQWFDAFDSFTDNGDGTVTQVNTGLMWVKCSEGQTGSNCTGTASTMTWSAALMAANNSRLGGYSDWRVPNVKELQALVDHSRSVPAINTVYFPNTPCDYWSEFQSSSSIASAAFPLVRVVNFHDGSVRGELRDSSYHVRFVRDASGPPPTKYTLNINNVGNVGIVSSTDNQISCGATCSANFNIGTSVTLNATADSNSVFTGWSGGGCSGTGDCTVN